MKKIDFYKLSEKNLEELCSKIRDAMIACKLDSLQAGLSGELGSGKTTWMRHYLRAIGYEGVVVSPTYTLLEEYNVGSINLIHVDLYRLNDHFNEQEFESLGLRERISNPSNWIFIEWPERVKEIKNSLDLLLSFKFINQEYRDLCIMSKTKKGSDILKAISELVSN